MSHRFFADSPIANRAILTGQEAQHLLKVMRAKVGDEITIFDGSGVEFLARIARLSRHDVELEVLERHEISCELSFRLTIGVALPKGERQRWLVEKLTELGVTELIPLHTERGVAQPTGAALERLRRAVIEASKQCGRNRLLQIAEPLRVIDFCGSAPVDARKWLAHPRPEGPASMPGPLHTRNGATQKASDVFAAIGPEGGFTTAEVSHALSQGWQAVSLGSRILRTETAAIALAAVAAVP